MKRSMHDSEGGAEAMSIHNIGEKKPVRQQS